LAGAIARRLGAAVPTLILVTLVVFFLVHLAPGDPLASGPDDTTLSTLPPEQLEALRSLYHLDQPLHRQYLLWLGDLLRGDLGRSFHDRRPVADKIGERVGTTLLLNTLALSLMLLVALPLGVAAALHPGSRCDRWSGVATYALYSVPVFWAGLVLQLTIAGALGWLPLSGLRSVDADLLPPLDRIVDRAAHLVLPVICLAYGGVAYLSRFVRGTLLDSAAPEAWRAARARGLSAPAVVWRHGLRQAGLPLLTLAGLLLPALVGGSVIVETVFAIPGLGRLFVDATFHRDVPVLLGLTLLTGTATLAGILLADLAYLVADPRTRRG
jgi:peptide/nickel transport system permease protein